MYHVLSAVLSTSLGWTQLSFTITQYEGNSVIPLFHFVHGELRSKGSAHLANSKTRFWTHTFCLQNTDSWKGVENQAYMHVGLRLWGSLWARVEDQLPLWRPRWWEPPQVLNQSRESIDGYWISKQMNFLIDPSCSSLWLCGICQCFSNYFKSCCEILNIISKESKFKNTYFLMWIIHEH